MLTTILLSILICICSGIFAFFLISIKKALFKNKIKLSQALSAIKFLNSKSKLHDEKLDSIISLLKNLELKSLSSNKSHDFIEHHYDRAKQILKNNDVTNGDDLLNSCNLTAEELELLSELVNKD